MNEDFQKFLIYQTPNNQVRVDVFLQNETAWLTQKAMAALFDVDRTVITKHIQNIYSEGELDKEATSAKIAQVQIEGERSVTRNIEY